MVQNDQQRSADPSRTVLGMTDPLKVTEDPGTEPMLFDDDNPGLSLINEKGTYAIEDSTRVFLDLAFALKKPVDNKTRIRRGRQNLRFQIATLYKMP